MKTHKKKQIHKKKRSIFKKKIHILNRKTQKGNGPLDAIKRAAVSVKDSVTDTAASVKQSAKDWKANASEKAEERGNRRAAYVKGQVADKFRALGHAFANMENPIVTAYQLIEKNVFGWSIPAKPKPTFAPKHKSVSFKQFLKSDIPELTQKAKKKDEEKKKKEEEEKKKKEEEEKKKAEEEKKKAATEAQTKPQVPQSAPVPEAVVNS